MGKSVICRKKLIPNFKTTGSYAKSRKMLTTLLVSADPSLRTVIQKKLLVMLRFLSFFYKATLQVILQFCLQATAITVFPLGFFHILK